MGKIAFLVSENYEFLISKAVSFKEEFSALEPCFRTKGFSLEKVIWTSSFNPNSYDALIPKAVWDYFDRPSQFRDFLNSIESGGAFLVNSASTVRWNMDKRYLDDCRLLGMPILAFKLFPKGSKLNLREICPFPDTPSLLLKPSISGGAKNTAVFRASETQQQQELAEKILSYCDLIIQPFYEEVQAGEYSFFFFNNQFSHAIVKVPAGGDFRAHSFFNSINTSYLPSNSEIAEAHSFLGCTTETCAFSRVDLLRVQGSFMLVELELIEPYLYFELAGNPKKAMEMFTSAVVSKISP